MFALEQISATGKRRHFHCHDEWSTAITKMSKSSQFSVLWVEHLTQYDDRFANISMLIHWLKVHFRKKYSLF